MKLKLTFFYAVLCGVVILIYSGCGNKQRGYWQGDKIDAGMREDFHERNEEVLEALKSNKIKDIEPYLSNELIKSPTIRREMELISNKLKEDKFELHDEYYAINKYRDFDTIKTKNTGINNYMLRYEAFAEEMYIAIFTPKTGDEKWIVTAVFAKLDYGWKLCQIDMGPYTFEAKTAPKLYKLAAAKLNKGQPIDAKLTMDLASLALKPSNIWQYAFEHEMRLFESKLSYAAMQKFDHPLVLEQVQGKPRIFSIALKTIPQGTYPAVYYLTNIPLKDKARIIEQNNQIKKAIGKIMPGIDKGRKYIQYTAFNERTNLKYAVDRYEMLDTLQ